MAALLAVLILSAVALTAALSAATVAQDDGTSLTFPNQDPGEDDTVTIENVTTGENTTIVVTYRDGPVASSPQVVAGMADADDLDGEDVTVGLQDTGGIPGQHTAWVVNDTDLPDDLAAGDNAAAVVEAAIASDVGAVPPTGELTFPDQGLTDDNTVTVADVSTGQASTVIVSYSDGDAEIVAGMGSADSIFLDVTLELQDDSGFPGEHTAWVFDDDEVPDDLEIGDDISDITDAALDSDAASVTEVSAGEVTVTDQELGVDDSMTVEDVTTAQESTLVVTYADGDEEVIAGVAPANDLDGESVSLELQNTSAVPGEHTVWLFDDSDVSVNMTTGNDISDITDAALDSGTAELSEQGGGDNNNSEDDDGDADDDGPGFGVAIAALALIGAAMLALQRQR